MANLCSTKIVFYSNNKTQLHEFNARLQELGSCDLLDVCRHFDLPSDEFECRGYVYDIEMPREDYIKSYFYIYQEDKWAPQIDVWSAVLDAQYDEIYMHYIAEEPGHGIYINTDSTGEYFPDRFVVDYCLPNDNIKPGYEDCAMEYFSTINEMVDYFVYRFNMPTCSSIEEIIQWGEKLILNCEDIRHPYYFSINEYEGES